MHKYSMFHKTLSPSVPVLFTNIEVNIELLFKCWDPYISKSQLYKTKATYLTFKAKHKANNLDLTSKAKAKGKALYPQVQVEVRVPDIHSES